MRKLQKYSEQRKKQQEQQHHQDGGQMEIIKEQPIEESLADIDAKMADAGEEKKQQQQAYSVVPDLEKYASDDSAEGVDSDDLEDEIKDPVMF